MNRFKKELVKKGFQLKSDFPLDVKGRFGEPGYIYLDDISVDTEKATVTEWYNIIVNKFQVLRNGNIENIPNKGEEAF